MSLRFAILGVLTATPMTGYDLVQYFRDSVGYVWSAPQSQIYPELRRMEAEGLVQATVAPRGKRAKKRIYTSTPGGEAALRAWAADSSPYPPDRDAVRLKAVFFDVAPPQAARAQLHAHVEHYLRRLEQWESRASALRAGTTPLVRQRLAQRPREEHAAIRAFKAWAFDGQAARARAEITWAEQGLALIQNLGAQVGAVSCGDAKGSGKDDTPDRATGSSDSAAGATDLLPRAAGAGAESE